MTTSSTLEIEGTPMVVDHFHELLIILSSIGTVIYKLIRFDSARILRFFFQYEQYSLNFKDVLLY